MNEFSSTIEALEHRWMRGWIARERSEMKALASRDLVVLFGTEKPVILDRASWLDATESRMRCTSYRFGPVYVRRHGKTAMFTAPVELDLTIDREPLLGKAFVTSLWQKTAVRRRWLSVERVFAGIAESAELYGAIRSMQLWR